MNDLFIQSYTNPRIFPMCRECGRELPENTDICIHCGRPKYSEMVHVHLKKSTKIAILCVVILCLFHLMLSGLK